MASAEDIADRVADEIARWLDRTAAQVAEAILQSTYRPRVVEPTKAETVGYFRPLLVNPDNTLNEAGKQQVIAQYGATGYEDIAKAVAKEVMAEKDAILAQVEPIDLSAYRAREVA